MKRTLASRSIGRGLAKVEPTSPNTLIAYSAKAGSTALDGDSKNSPFTIALAKHLTTPGLDVRRAFGFVRDDVLKDHRQSAGAVRLWLAWRRRRAAGAGQARADGGCSAARANPQAEARRDYELALQIGNKDALNAFLAQYPDGFYANLARIQLDKIAAEEARVAATEKARLAEQERARLAAEGAQKAQQLKAPKRTPRPPKQARLAAEKAKQVAQEQAADAEQQRAAAEAAAAGRRRRRQTLQSPIGPPTSSEAASANAPATNLAALTPGPSPRRRHQIGADRVAPGRLSHRARRWRMERGVAALADAVQPQCRHQARRQARQPRHARCDQAQARPGLSAGLRARLQGRWRPLQQIVCAEGSFLNDDNECEKRRGKNDRPRDDDRGDRPRAGPGTRAAGTAGGRNSVPRGPGHRGQGSGQIVCDSIGCRPVQRGCHLEFRTTAQGGPVEGGGGNVQICN